MTRADHTDPAKKDPRPAIIAGGAAGLIGGLVASWLMVEFQRRIWPPPKGDEASSTGKLVENVAAWTGSATLSDHQAKAGGKLVHYALGAGLGLAYGVAAVIKPGVALGRGAMFGVATELVIDQAVVPALGLANPFWKCPVEWHLRGLAAHIVFGVATDATRRYSIDLFDTVIAAR